MITYLGITLNNRKFYVGSAVDFEQRQKEHKRDKRSSSHFHNSLRKNPEGVYWIASEDDGLDTREEEQFYLDFYHGSEWCYNLSSSAYHPGVESCRQGGVSTHTRHPEIMTENGFKSVRLKSGIHDPKNKNLVVEGSKKGGVKTTELHREEQKEWLNKAREAMLEDSRVAIELEDKDGNKTQHESVKAAAEFIGCASTHVTRCARGRRNLVSGYKARYI